ncbi:MAG: bifunctional diguanylate cyclase/phosphodiesterase [Ilumatobacteraceae bacterium]|nr:bifunctional diguanylate cyclase/phosphodiesterase [Ilumatobacteraceae bacterium]
MPRTLRSAPWLFAAGAIAFAVAGIGFDVVGGPVWRIIFPVCGIIAAAIGSRVHRLPWFITAAVAIGGIRVGFLHGERLTAADITSLVSMLATNGVGVALLVPLAFALRLRRGRLDQRDGIDLITLAIGAAMSTWIVITSRLIFVHDERPVIAVIDTLYLPLAILLFTFVVDLLLTGLARNRSMQMITAAAGVNMLGSVLAGFNMVDIVTTDRQFELALYCAAFLFFCAGLTHRQGADILEQHGGSEPSAAYTPFRLLLTGGCLVVPGVLVATLAPFGNADLVIRASAFLALVCTVIARLFIAIRSHEAANRELSDRLHLDDLTRLPTRARFAEEVDAVLDSTWRSEFQPTIIQLNLDRFKNINDSLGHYEANEVLVLVSERLTEAASRFGGVVGRSGGDDFVIVDATTRSQAEASERAEEIRAALHEPLRVGETSVYVTASFGVVTAPRHRTLTAEELMRRADIATHRAKAAGRNSVAVFDDSMQSHLARRMDLEHGLHGAIGRQEMRLYHQPIVDVATGAISGFESLIRWQRDGTIIPPVDFISIAEETGIICELGAWALHEALGELRGWIDDDVVGPTTTISVNVSPRQIADPDFAKVVRRALDDTGMPPNLLWLEVTESMMLEEPELALHTLREIRDMGVGLALDDFGTGYSSLSLLQQFPIQRIKIDRAFVNGIAEQGTDRSLVRTVIAMAQSMGLDLVAEGVETVHQLRVLSELRCDKAQGYLISRPVPADAMRSTMVALDALGSLSMFEPNGAPATVTPATDDEPSRTVAYPIGVGGMSSRPLGQPVL